MTERPIASGPDPLMSPLDPSTVANTVRTSTRVVSSSTAIPWFGVTPGPNVVRPDKVIKAQNLLDCEMDFFV